MTYADGFSLRDKDAATINNIADAADGLLTASTQIIDVNTQSISTTSWTDLTGCSQSVVVGSGETVLIFFQCRCYVDTVGDAISVQLLRDSTSLLTRSLYTMTAQENKFHLVVYVDKPTAGTYTYSAQFRNPTAARSITTYNRQLITLKFQES